MSNWTPKRALSGLMSKFRQSDSEESSNSSSGEERPTAAAPTGSYAPESDDSDEPMGLSTTDVSVSPLALMNENSAEAWLGQFLLKLDAPTSTARGTIEGAKRDTALLQYLNEVHASAAEAQPLGLLESGYADQLKKQDWAAWWKAQGALLSFCYSTLALSLLDDRSYVADIVPMYKQEGNMQLHKDAHYVLCYMLGKPWPSYHVTEADLGRLAGGGLET